MSHHFSTPFNPKILIFLPIKRGVEGQRTEDKTTMTSAVKAAKWVD